MRATSKFHRFIPKCAFLFLKAKEFEGIKIIRYEASIYYANVEYFVEKINKLSEMNPTGVLEKLKKIKDDHKREMRKALSKGPDPSPSFWQRIMFWKKSRGQIHDTSVVPTVNALDDEAVLKRKKDDVLKQLPIQHIIIDFSCVNFIDSMGVNAIIQVIFEYIFSLLKIVLINCCVFL